MENQLSEMMIDLLDRTSKIEAKLDTHKEVLDKIEVNLTPVKEQVHRHEMILRSAGWLFGIVTAFFTTKFLGKF